MIDVREKDEWTEGFIPGARWISRGFLESRIEDPGALLGPQVVTLQVQPGQRAFLHEHVVLGGFFTSEWVPEDQAAEMVEKCGYRIASPRSGPPAPPFIYAPSLPQPPLR